MLALPAIHLEEGKRGPSKRANKYSAFIDQLLLTACSQPAPMVQPAVELRVDWARLLAVPGGTEINVWLWPEAYFWMETNGGRGSFHSCIELGNQLK